MSLKALKEQSFSKILAESLWWDFFRSVLILACAKKTSNSWNLHHTIHTTSTLLVRNKFVCLSPSVRFQLQRTILSMIKFRCHGQWKTSSWHIKELTPSKKDLIPKSIPYCFCRMPHSCVHIPHALFALREAPTTSFVYQSSTQTSNNNSGSQTVYLTDAFFIPATMSVVLSVLSSPRRSSNHLWSFSTIFSYPYQIQASNWSGLNFSSNAHRY